MSATLSSISPPPVPIAGYASRADAAESRSSTDATARSSTETVEERQVVQELSARDQEVRQHEMAHKAAGAGITGAVAYSYERGPDGRMYAVGGEVGIDTSAVSGDPEATLEKAEMIIRAAMAPAEPSAQDYKVAAQARAMAAEARAELARMDEPGQNEDQSDASVQEQKENRAGQEESRATLQRQLVETGALARVYPPGSLFSFQA